MRNKENLTIWAKAAANSIDNRERVKSAAKTTNHPQGSTNTPKTHYKTTQTGIKSPSSQLLYYKYEWGAQQKKLHFTFFHHFNTTYSHFVVLRNRGKRDVNQFKGQRSQLRWAEFSSRIFNAYLSTRIYQRVLSTRIINSPQQVPSFHFSGRQSVRPRSHLPPTRHRPSQTPRPSQTGIACPRFVQT